MQPMRADRTMALVTLAGISMTLISCSASTPNKFPAQVRENFVVSCAAQPGAGEALCGRCLELLEEQYDLDEFLELDTAIRLGTASRADSDKLTSIMIECSAS